jgi:hypothetical protein
LADGRSKPPSPAKVKSRPSRVDIVTMAEREEASK